METIENIVALFCTQLSHFSAIERTTFSPKDRDEMLALTVRELDLRGKVDALCRSYASALCFPVAAPHREIQEFEMLSLVHERFLQGVAFGGWLSKHLKMPEMPAQRWIEFLLVDSWAEYGVHYWRIRIENNMGR